MTYATAFPVGRSLRLLAGVGWTAMLWLGNAAVTRRPLPVLGFLGATVGLYVLATALVAPRLFPRVRPWLAAAIFDAPVLVALWPAAPDPVRLALLLFPGVSLVCAAVCGYGGCEVLAIPNMLLRRRHGIPCVVFTPVDLLERAARTALGRLVR